MELISSMIVIGLLANLVYMIIDTKRMRDDMKKFDKFDEHMLEDLKQTNLALEICKELDTRITKLENKEEK